MDSGDCGTVARLVQYRALDGTSQESSAVKKLLTFHGEQDCSWQSVSVLVQKPSNIIADFASIVHDGKALPTILGRQVQSWKLFTCNVKWHCT